jgi:undecaprenyl-diphosphatase
MTDQSHGNTTSESKPKIRKRTYNEVQKLLKHLKVTGWTFGLGLVTLIILVIVVLWYTGLPAYLKDHTPNWWCFALAATVGCGQYVGYAISLKAASQPRLPFFRTFELEVAEAVTYTYTPESLGSFALTIRFLMKKKLTSSQATAASGLSSTITTIVGAVILAIATVLAAATINANDLKKETPSSTWEVVLGVIVVAAAVTIMIKAPTLRQKVEAWLKQSWVYLLQVVRQPQRGLQIAAGECVTVLAQTACLTLVLLSLHATPKIAAVLVITQIAGLATSLVPVPGGLGAPEAILIAGLNAIGVHHAEAIIGAVTYRMLIYWLPPLPGAICLFNLYRKDLI